MTLSVILDYTDANDVQSVNGIRSWYLKVESVDHNISPTVSIIPLPTLSENHIDPFQNRPFAWCLSLGLIQETVTLHGVSPDNPDEADGTPTKPQLDEIVRCTSTNATSFLTNGQGSSALSFGAGVALRIHQGFNQNSSPTRLFPTAGANPSYHGVILQYQAHRDGGNTFWSWSLTLGVVDWNQLYFTG